MTSCLPFLQPPLPHQGGLHLLKPEANIFNVPFCQAFDHSNENVKLTQALRAICISSPGVVGPKGHVSLEPSTLSHAAAYSRALGHLSPSPKV